MSDFYFTKILWQYIEKLDLEELGRYCSNYGKKWWRPDVAMTVNGEKGQVKNLFEDKKSLGIDWYWRKSEEKRSQA